MDNKTIEIVTYCTNSSYGSIFQSLGLKRALLDLGYHSKVLLPKSTLLPKKMTIRRRIKRIALKFLTRNILKDSTAKNDDFINEHIDIEYYDDIIGQNDHIIDTPEKTYLAGSDQIWNPNYCFPFYFLDFIRYARRISYAASMGVTTVPEQNREKFCKFIDHFDAVSVREKECAEVIGKLTGREAEVNIDPTFLLPQEEWEKYESPYPIERPYALLYMLYWDDALKEKVKEFGRRKELKLIAICQNLSKVYADDKLYDVGPGEFLWLFHHAEYVITSSFHGAAFSIIFNKQFSAVINPAAPSRIRHLLRVLSVPVIPIEDLGENNRVDYVPVNKRIEMERRRSLAYLRGSLDHEQ